MSAVFDAVTHYSIWVTDQEQAPADGVQFTQEPFEHPYGIECAAQDPFGNQNRIAQPAAPSSP